MSLSNKRKDELNATCKKLRIDLIEILHKIQTGHPGGSLSVCEILTTLFLEKANYKASDPNWEQRDRIILTKGHAAPMLYLLLAETGFIPKDEIQTLRQINSRLQGHPCMNELPGVELTSGPLGIGVSAAVGIACGMRVKGIDSWVYAVMGDGELNEGVVWEAFMSAVKYKTDHLIFILDKNGVQLDGTTEQVMPMHKLRERFESFGLHVIEIDGHDVSAIADAIDEAKTISDKPKMIIANTVKGKGVSFMEGKSAWHGSPIGDKEYEMAMAELGGKE